MTGQDVAAGAALGKCFGLPETSWCVCRRWWTNGLYTRQTCRSTGQCYWL